MALAHDVRDTTGNGVFDLPIATGKAILGGVRQSLDNMIGKLQLSGVARWTPVLRADEDRQGNAYAGADLSVRLWAVRWCIKLGTVK